MKRRSKFPLKQILLVMVLVLAGVMIFNSGVLVDIGLLKGNIPDDIGIVENDPRVIPKEEGELNKEGVQKTIDTVISWITGKVPQGEIKIVTKDAAKGFMLSGFKYEIRDAVSDTVIETVVSDAQGLSLSKPLNYRTAYKVVQVETAEPYNTNDTEIIFEMKAPTVELHFDQTTPSHILGYELNEDGTVTVKEAKVDVPLILQKPELPNGCEITAVTSVLNYYGYDVDKITLSDNFLPKLPFYRSGGKLYGADPEKAFSGDPRDAGGWFVYAPPTVKAAQDYVDSVGGKHKVLDVTGSTSAQIMDYVLAGKPVAIWATRDLSLANFGYGWYLDGTETYFEAATNLHCMVIYGFIDNQLYVMDPLEGNMIYDQAQFFASYESLGSRAIVIEEPAHEQ